jgi:hypothetical protein
MYASAPSKERTSSVILARGVALGEPVGRVAHACGRATDGPCYPLFRCSTVFGYSVAVFGEATITTAAMAAATNKTRRGEAYEAIAKC